MIVDMPIGKIHRIQSYFIQQTIHGVRPVHLYYSNIFYSGGLGNSISSTHIAGKSRSCCLYNTHASLFVFG